MLSCVSERPPAHDQGLGLGFRLCAEVAHVMTCRTISAYAVRRCLSRLRQLPEPAGGSFDPDSAKTLHEAHAALFRPSGCGKGHA